MDLVEVLKQAVVARASDIHLVIGKPPMMRLNGEIQPVAPQNEVLTAESAKHMIYSILFEDQRARFEENWELDCSFAIKGLCRFRVNVLMQKNGVESVMRVISSQIPSADQVKLTPQMIALADLPRGLVLVTGPTGSGKSTTLACIIEQINQTHQHHILTIEDPIEFTYDSKKSIIRQREVGQNTKSFAAALRAALRQDPDVILVGEMRDLETIQLAITAAETGHLCFGTLHTQSAPSTIDRIIDVFPPHQQAQIRVQLASGLQAVIAQILLPKKGGKGRVAARELMTMTPAISNLIREGKTHMIYNAIETGVKFGMMPMDRSLAELVNSGVADLDVALTKAHNPDALQALCRGGGAKVARTM
ncbi:MAG: type IV pilus twitching motility protein PilT [Elusimicrobia bacterium]|nr:type IV pilus twitching motility protein PilT [Elusimicrobiota bacterium]